MAPASGDYEDLKKQVEELRRQIEEISVTNASEGCFDDESAKEMDSHKELKKRRTLKGHFGKIYAMHWAGDTGKEGSAVQLVSASQDGKLIIWDGMTTNKKNAIPLRSSWVMTCAFERSENKLVACGGLDNLCSIFKTSNNGSDGSIKVHQELQGHDGYLSCCRFKSTKEIITSSGDSTCVLWDVESGSAKANFSDHGGDVMSVALCPTDENIFVSGSCDTTAKVWDLRVSSSVLTFKGHESDINTVAIFPDGNALGTGSDDSCCKLFDRRACLEVNQFRDDAILCGITSVDFSCSGRILFAGYDDYSCHAWDTMMDGAKPKKYSGHENRVSCLGVDTKGQALCTGSWDTALHIYV